MKQTTTLKKIARALHISVSTVSRALKNNPAISLNTRQKVTELAKALEYEPNINAVQLRTNNSKILGLIVPSVSGYFYNSFISSVEQECSVLGYSLLVLQSGNNGPALLNNLVTCRQNRVNGIFVCADFLSDLDEFQKLESQHIPIIFFDKVPDTNAFHKVCLEDEKAAALAARHILEKKKQHVLALFGDKNLSITVKRLRSFKQTFEMMDADVTLYIETGTDTAKAKILTAAYLDTQNIDCIFCMSDEILTGAMRALLQSGKKYPDDVGIIAISHGFFPTLYFPEITYVETNGSELGKLAFRQMLECIKEKKEPEEIYLSSGFIQGGSL